MKVAGKHYRSLWADESQGVVHIIDQVRLPHVFETATLRTVDEVAQAIKAMHVRGAPLIGVAAAFGIALAVSRDPSDASISEASNKLRVTRPTAVNLAWAIGRMREKLAPVKPSERRVHRHARVVDGERARTNLQRHLHGGTDVSRDDPPSKAER